MLHVWRIAMAGKQAKILSRGQERRALRQVATSRNPERDRVILLLSTKAGLRAGEIAKLTWPMVLTPSGAVGDRIELHDLAAKKRSGRTIPMHPALRRALVTLRQGQVPGPFVIRSERGAGMRPSSVVNWFATLYQALGLEGCSSHSGRRTFITRAAQVLAKSGGSLRDVQQLAGHSSIEQTQAYIEGNNQAKRRLVALL
jgi:integrase/recombinase XerD